MLRIKVQKIIASSDAHVAQSRDHGLCPLSVLQRLSAHQRPAIVAVVVILHCFKGL